MLANFGLFVAAIPRYVGLLVEPLAFSQQADSSSSSCLNVLKWITSPDIQLTMPTWITWIPCLDESPNEEP